MLAEVRRFVNWIRRRNPKARTWRDYSYDLKQFVEVVGDLIEVAGLHPTVDAPGVDVDTQRNAPVHRDGEHPVRDRRCRARTRHHGLQLEHHEHDGHRGPLGRWGERLAGAGRLRQPFARRGAERFRGHQQRRGVGPGGAVGGAQG